MPVIEATVYFDETYVLVQTDLSGTVIHDPFDRTVNPGFGVAPTGQTWTTTGGAAGDYFTGPFGPSSVATISNATVGVTRFATVPLGFPDFEVIAEGVMFGVDTATGAGVSFYLAGRYTDTANHYLARMQLTTAGVVTIAIMRRVAGVLTTLAGPVNVSTVSTATTPWSVAFRGVQTRLEAVVWSTGTNRPTTFQVAILDASLVTGNDVGILGFLEAGNTNPLPVEMRVDLFQAINPGAVMADCAIVTRRNTVTGEVVQLRPYVSFDAEGAMILECGQGLWWDTEPPLNVELEYCVIPCDAMVAATANSSFEFTTAPWVGINGTLVQNCAVSKISSCSAQMTPNGTNTNPAVQQTGFTLDAGRLVTASGWARSPQGWNSVLLRLQVVYSDMSVDTIETDYVTLDDGEWRFLSMSFVPRLDVTSATFSFVIAGLPPNTVQFNLDGLQVAQSTVQPATECVTVTVDSESVWLKSPLHPCDDIEIGLCSPMAADCGDDVRVTYVGTSDDTYNPNTVLLSPANRKYPIPINRVRRAPTATLRLLAHDCTGKDAVLQINEPGDPLLFQAPADYCIPDRYISVGAHTETRFSVDQRDEFRLMTLPYATVERPEGSADGPCGTRIDDLCDLYASWGALTMAGFTWTDLMLGEASPNGPGQPDPPELARDWEDVEIDFTDWLEVEDGGARDWQELKDGL